MMYIIIAVAVVAVWVGTLILAGRYGAKEGYSRANQRFIKIMEKTVETMNEIKKDVADEFDPHDTISISPVDLDEFLATHECDKHKPVHSASERRRIAESLKAHNRNRKPTGQFAKGSKKKS